MKYCAIFITGAGHAAAGDGFFNGYIAKTAEPVIWQAIFIVATAVILIGGVKGGIEKASKILMPLLVLLSVFIAGYTMFLPGAMEGLKYLFVPHLKDFSIETVLAAMGQMFYSMSLAMGIMVTYGSYVKKSDDIEKSVSHVEVFDTAIAILAAMMIVPAVFVFSNGDPAALGQGAGLLFDMLPKVFDSMPGGGFIGALFFVLVFFAAITSSVSILEVIVSTVCDQFHWRRKPATVVVALLCLVMGIPCSLGYGLWDSVSIIGYSILDFVDFVTNSIMLPIVALLTCVLIGYVTGPQVVVDEVKLSSDFRREKLYRVMVRYIAPIFLAAILLTSITNALGITSI